MTLDAMYVLLAPPPQQQQFRNARDIQLPYSFFSKIHLDGPPRRPSLIRLWWLGIADNHSRISVLQDF